ncbi:lipid A export permease/ATP-binding protein MsbA [Marinobacterium jannaschii]|uniref:lipid A export permease/ATP-binding protein MsbA n=1 Tax=Marinobacterium jannaschii TaxID=64970 RepID=UPI00048A205E|nr:lipid A export permease/ATP-binding protein MsbA [Marinobacterium jannaschii]
MPLQSDSAHASSWRVYLRLLTYVRPYWFTLVVSVLGFGLYAGTQAGFAKWLQYVVDSVSAGDLDARGWLALSVIGLFFVRGIGSFLGLYSISYAARHVINNLRKSLFDHMLRLPSAFFQGSSNGQILSRFTYNVEQVTDSVTMALRILLREGLTVIGLFGYLIYLNWKLTAIFLVVMPVVALLVTLAAKRFRKLSGTIQDSVGDVAHVATEVVNGIDVVRVFGGIEAEQKRFHEASDRNRQQFMKLVVTEAISTPLIQLIVASALSILVYMAMHPSLMAAMSAGEFISFITAAGMIAKPLRQLTSVNSVIQKGIAAADSVFEILDEKVEQDNGILVVEECRGDLRFKDLCFRYQGADSDAIRNLSLDVKAGESVAFVGRSGSGKSTLVSLLPRFGEPTSGSIYLDDVVLKDYSLNSLRKQISIVNQNVVLFDGTLAENIAYGALATCSAEQVRRAAEAAHVVEFADRLPQGLNTLIGSQGISLSGGQRQRIAIARALLKDAPILILDEATSALDSESERHIQDAMHNVMRGRTTLVIAHRLSTIEDVDRIVVLDQGQIAEVGSHAELLALDGIYAQLHSLQYQRTSE